MQLTIALLVLCSTDVTIAEEPNVQRLKMFSSMGKELDVLNGYQQAELLNREGRGCLTHMWFGGDWPGYERTRIRIYVDDEQSPSIDMELGLGHALDSPTVTHHGAASDLAKRVIRADYITATVVCLCIKAQAEPQRP